MAKKKKVAPKASKQAAQGARLIVSDEANPSVTLEPGMKFQVVSVTLCEGDTLKPTKVAARLCGGTSTCIALIDIE